MQKIPAPDHSLDRKIIEAELDASTARLKQLEKALAHAEQQIAIETGRRKVSEAILQETRDKSEALERIINQSHVVVFSWQAQRGSMVTFVTDNVCRFGYSPQDFYTGKVQLPEIVHPADRQRVTAELTRNSSNPAITFFFQKYRIFTADGQPVWIDDCTRIIRDKNGKITRYEGIFLDISESKKNEEELLKHRDHLEELVLERTTELAEAKGKAEEAVKAFRLQHDFLNTLVETIPNPLFYKDSEGRYTGCNAAFERYLGKSRNAIIGKTVFEMAPANIAERYHAEDQKLINKPGAQHYTWKIPRADGVLRDVIFDKATIFDNDGKAIGLLGIITDITELVEARQSAEVANNAKGEFLANMSHEIRTPLNGIIGMSGLLLNTQLTPEQHQYAQTVVTCGRALLTILNDILDFSKIEAGRLQFESIDFDLRDLMAELHKIILYDAELKGLFFVIIIDPKVPMLLQGDPTRLRQVLLNLAGNAVKFTESGKVTIEVILKAETSGRATIQFRVNDTGIGIAADQRHLLFQSFSQIDSSFSRKYGGTGLGLAICKKLVEMMGGTIGVKSRQNHGSTFWFDVVLEKSAESASHVTPVALLPDFRKNGRAIRILLAEDNFINQTVVMHILNSLGCQVIAVENGHQVLDLLQDHDEHFDMILMDIQMPEMDGLEAARAIREVESRRQGNHGELQAETADPHQTQRIPIIALTAHAMTGDRRKCLDAGMDDFLAKPVVPAILAAKIKQWLPDTEQLLDPAQQYLS